jgi:hypothetical protein
MVSKIKMLIKQKEILAQLHLKWKNKLDALNNKINEKNKSNIQIIV